MLEFFEIPPYQVDPSRLPPPLLTSEPGSFAHHTLKDRIPPIVEEALQINSFPTPIRTAVQELHSEIIGGRIRLLREETPDQEFWNEVSRDYAGHSWLDVPWYWAEAFVYRRLLEATQYFQPGPGQNVDPYRAKKQTELEPGAAPRQVEETLRDLPEDLRARFEALTYASLWGNRIDLSYALSASIGRAERLEDERANLVVDDIERVWEFVQAPHVRHAPRPGVSLAIMTDNAGTELAMDLALVDFMLETGLAGQIVLHLKAQPFFVSDAMPRDVEAELDALGHGGKAALALSERLRGHFAHGRLRLYTHWLYTTSLFYFQLPDDLLKELATMDLVIVKGDANYRRLLGDAHWPPTTSFAHATAYFPAPLVALRTLKSELIVGLPEGEAERQKAQDAHWMVNGRRGIVQANLGIDKAE